MCLCVCVWGSGCLQLESDHGLEGPCVRCASNWSERGCASEYVITSKDQARLAGEYVKCPGSEVVSGSLRVSSGCESACVSVMT